MFATRFFTTAPSVFLLLSACVVGCGPSGITGGTPGLLMSDGNPIRDVEVSMYSSEAAERIAYAVTGSDGSFRLVRADSGGSLNLQPGSYTVTLESVGAPTDLPAVYRDRRSTPLQVTWRQGERIELNVPGLKLKGTS